MQYDVAVLVVYVSPSRCRYDCDSCVSLRESLYGLKGNNNSLVEEGGIVYASTWLPRATKRNQARVQFWNGYTPSRVVESMGMKQSCLLLLRCCRCNDGWVDG